MLKASPEASAAMAAPYRRILPTAVIDLTDPDIIYHTPETSGHGKYARLEQLYDKNMETAAKYATPELNRWTLDGSFSVFPENPADTTGNVGYIGDMQSGEDGMFQEPYPWVQLNISEANITQAAGIVFAGNSEDGYGTDFVFDIYSGSDIVHTHEVTGNTSRQVNIEGFTVYSVTSIRVTFRRWSMPGRYPRAVEIIPGIYEEWRGDTISSVDVMEETDLSCVRQPPYETAVLEISNKSRRFDSRIKSGLFRSIEERQGVPLYFDIKTENGYERIPRGVFYQQNGGWETLSNGLMMRFKLVSITGLLSARRFIPPEALPGTLEGWIRAIVSQLGENFKDRYIIRDADPDTPLVCDKENVENITCPQLLRYVCMASGTYPRMDTETGRLLIEPPPLSGGTALTLSSMNNYPSAKANDDIAAITFQLNDDQKTLYTISGNNSAGRTFNISNLFIKTKDQANTAARNILRHYGGQRYEARGRGDLRSELGDADVIELGFGAVSGGRRIKQQLKMTGGTIKNALSVLLQAASPGEYSNTVVITQSGKWTAPNGVTELKITLVGGGQGGSDGTDGSMFKSGQAGKGGSGGRIYTETININPGQTLDISIGAGGQPGQSGGDTTLGQYSSRYGGVYGGWVDLTAGNAYGRNGADGKAAPKSGEPYTGDGGDGGAGGSSGAWDKDGTITVWPTHGKKGGSGGSGAVLISYDFGEAAL